jgi:hypothetical protein
LGLNSPLAARTIFELAAWCSDYEDFRAFVRRYIQVIVAREKMRLGAPGLGGAHGYLGYLAKGFSAWSCEGPGHEGPVSLTFIYLS